MSKNYRKFWWFELATVTSQALKYDVIIYTPFVGLNYTILDKIKPLLNRIGEPPEIKIGCYKGQQHHTDSHTVNQPSFGMNKIVQRLCQWNFHLLSF